MSSERKYGLIACGIYRQLKHIKKDELLNIQVIEWLVHRGNKANITRLYNHYVIHDFGGAIIQGMLYHLHMHTGRFAMEAATHFATHYSKDFDYQAVLGNYISPLAQISFPKQAREMAQHIFSTRDFVQCLVLADMLEEDSFPSLLTNHLRIDGMQRGYWSLDLVAGYA